MNPEHYKNVIKNHEFNDQLWPDAKTKEENWQELYRYIDNFLKQQYANHGFIKDVIQLGKAGERFSMGDKIYRCRFANLEYFIVVHWIMGEQNVPKCYVDMDYLNETFPGFSFSIVNNKWFFDLFGSYELVIKEKGS